MTNYLSVNRSRALVLVPLLVVLLGIIMVGEAFAHGTWYWYDLTVPRFGGSAVTNNQSKQYTDQSRVHSHLIGGSYDLNVKLEDVNNGSLSSYYKINDWTTVTFSTSAYAGQTVHARLKTDNFDPVNIQANGHWSPDDP